MLLFLIFSCLYAWDKGGEESAAWTQKRLNHRLNYSQIAQEMPSNGVPWFRSCSRVHFLSHCPVIGLWLFCRASQKNGKITIAKCRLQFSVEKRCFLNYFYNFFFWYIVVSNQSCMIAVVQTQLKWCAICSLRHECFGVFLDNFGTCQSKFAAAHSPERG